MNIGTLVGIDLRLTTHRVQAYTTGPQLAGVIATVNSNIIMAYLLINPLISEEDTRGALFVSTGVYNSDDIKRIRMS